MSHRPRVLLALLAACLAAPAAGAQEGDGGFAPLSSVPAVRTSGEVLFLPLVAAFEACLPLTQACPQDSSSLLLVPAARRRLAWGVEATQLPQVSVLFPFVRPVGAPPPQADSARFLVPVVDGVEGNLVFVTARLSGGRLVQGGEGRGEGDTYVPALVGPLLSTATPSPTPLGRIFDAPTTVAGSELTDAVSVLVARRAAPNRVAMGVRPDPAWNLDRAFVPLLDADGVAVLARHHGRVGIAAAVSSGNPVVPGGGETRGGDDIAWPLLVAAGVVAMFVVGLVVRRRRHS